MKKLFQDQKKELESIIIRLLKTEEDEKIKFQQREEIFKKQIEEMKEKQEKLIHSGDILGFHQIMREIMNINNYNELSVESKKFFIQNIVNYDNDNGNKIDKDNDDDNYLASLFNKIIVLKKFYELVTKINDNSVDLPTQIDFIYNKIEKIVIDFKLTNLLFKNKMLQTNLLNLACYIDDINIEIEYPSQNFDEIFALVSEIFQHAQDVIDGKTINSTLDKSMNKSEKILKKMKIAGKKISFKIFLFIDIDLFDFSSINKDYIQNLRFGPNVKRIKKKTFYNWNNLTNVDLSSSLVTVIENEAFYGCEALKDISFPSSLTSIGANVFYECNSLKKIEIPLSVSSIGSQAFYDCYLLNEVTILSQIKLIEDSTFYNCSSLQEILIPPTVTSIGSNAFYKCSSLKRVFVPPSVTSIGNNAFDGCDNIKIIECDPFQISLTNIIPNRSVNYLIINTKSEKLTNINLNQFSDIQMISIPNTVKSIGDSFCSGCSYLQRINIPDSVTSIGSSAFYGCSKLQQIIIPKSVTSIGSSAFYDCSNLQQIIIPKSVTSIESSAFYGCSNLQQIIIPKSVTSIGSSVFYGCSSLKQAIIDCQIDTIQSQLFYNCKSLEKVSISPSIKSIENQAFYNCKIKEVECDPCKIPLSLLSSYNSITDLTIKTNSKTFNDAKLYRFSSLIQITIISPITTIGDNAFYNCSTI